MQIPLEVNFAGIDPSEAVRGVIEREVERLEKHNSQIIGCRVAVIAASHKHRHGSGLRIHISLTVPPHESVSFLRGHGTNRPWPFVSFSDKT